MIPSPRVGRRAVLSGLGAELLGSLSGMATRAWGAASADAGHERAPGIE